MVKHLNIDGHHIGGLTGFLKSIGYVIRTIKPTRVILVFDGQGGSTAKRNLYPEYKANRKLKRITNWDGFDSREEESESITNQLLRLIAYLKCLPVDLVIVDKVEADDVIGYLAKQFTEEVYIVSTDSDYLQLVTPRVTLYSPVKKKFYTPSTIKSEYGVSSENFLNYKILLGDKSDNVPGVQGMGAKKILKLLPELAESKRYSLQDVLKLCEERHPINKLYYKTVLYRKQLEINNILMNLHEPLLSEENKQGLQELLQSPSKNFDMMSFLTLYNEDRLEGSITSPKMWLYDTFQYLLAYKSPK